MSQQPSDRRTLRSRRSRRSTSVAVTGAAMAVALLAAACGSSSKTTVAAPAGASATAAQPATGAPIEVGATDDLSAQFSVNGIGIQTGMSAAFDAINKAGGVKNQPLHLTSLDDAAKVDRGVANVTQLLTQNKVAVLGGYLLSNICVATQQAAADVTTPMICNAGDPKQFGTPPTANVFLPTVLAANENQAGFALAKQLVGGTAKPKVALIGLASASLIALQDAQKATIASLGWELGPDITVPLTTTDLTAQGAQIASAKPDIIFSNLADATSILLDRALQANGSKSPVIATDATTAVTATTTKDPNFYYLSTVSNGGTPGAGYQKFQDAVKAAGGDPSKPFVDRGYVQGLIIAEALKGCNGCTGQALIDQMNKLNIDTDGFTASPISFSPTDHQGIHKMFAYHWDSTKSTVALQAKDLPTGQ